MYSSLHITTTDNGGAFLRYLSMQILCAHVTYVISLFHICIDAITIVCRWESPSALYNKRDFFMWIKGGIDSLYCDNKCRELERWYEIAPWMVHSHCIICVHSCRLSSLNDRQRRSEKVVNTAASFRLTLSFTSFLLLRHHHLYFLPSHRKAFNLFSLRESEIISLKLRGVITR